MDNQNIINKLKYLLHIYKKSQKRIQLNYFLKYKKQIELIKSKQYKYKSFISNSNNVHNRLYNNLKTKRENIDKLSQKIFQDEAKKYTYYPEINKYDLIFKNYYIVNIPPYYTDNKSERKNTIKTEISNIKKKYKSYRKIPTHEINNHYYSVKKNNNNIIYPKNKNSKIKYYNSIIKKNISVLNELEEEKNNRVTSKIIHYKNTIPNNYKKYNQKTIKNGKTKKINQKIENIKKNINSNVSQRTNEITDLTSFYSSPITQNELNNMVQKNSKQNSEILNAGNSKNNSYYAQSRKNDSNKNNLSMGNNKKNKFILSPNNEGNSHCIFRSGLTTIEMKDYYEKNKYKSNSFKNLPKNECSLVFEGRKNKSNLNSNNIYDRKKSNINKNRYNCLTSNNYRQLNSLGLIDNSISTNFVDRPSINDNNTLSGNDYNQHSIIYNKIKNISYTFPSKGNNISLNNEDMKSNIYYKKSNTKKIRKKNQKKIYNRIMIDRNLDNITSNTINTDSSSKNPKINNNNNNDNYKEKFDCFNIINDLIDKNHKTKNNLKIASGEVNENVNHKRNTIEEGTSISQKSEVITIQSMSDSKFMEIANYYLNDEEIVDRIKIDNILTTKNSKSNYNLGEKNQ